MALHKLKDEIFSIGEHEGFDATPQVLRDIVDNFKKLRDNFRVPLKLGHDDDQPLTDGQPAIGWVDSLTLDSESSPTKVIAQYVDMPKIVFEAIKNKMYRSRSIELEHQVRDGELVRNILTAVALLGSKLPRVEKLNDLGKYFNHGADKTVIQSFSTASGRDTSITTRKRIMFRVSDNQLEGHEMTAEEIKKLQDDLAAANLASAKLIKEKAELEVEKETFSKKLKENETETMAALVKAARGKVETALNEAVKAEQITPARREVFAKMLGVADDKRVLDITDDMLTELVGESTKFSKTSTTKKVDETEANEAPDAVLSRKVFAHMEKSGSSDFSKSLNIVMRAEPKLAREYITANGETE